MDVEKRLTIVSSARALSYFPRKHIDAETIHLLHDCIQSGNPKTDYRNPLINLLDCYLGLTGQNISYSLLSKKSTIPILHGFIGALSSPNFVGASAITKDIYRRAFSAALESIVQKIPNLAFDLNHELALHLWQQMKIDPLQKEYYQGWFTRDKNGKRAGGIRLAWIWNILGPNEARALHNAACRYSERYEAESKGNFLPVLNALLDYIERYHSCSGKVDLNNPDVTTKLIEGFCRNFFETKVDTKKCLETTIKRWNDALPFLEVTLLESGVFARPYRKFPYIEPSRKIGAETKISTNEDGLQIKEKLIVEIPLTLTDDEVIKLLFKEINDAVDIVHKWACKEAKSLFGRFKENRGNFDFKDFDLSSSQIRAKYRKTSFKKAATSEIAYRLGLPITYSLEPFMYLLIKEHPLITESFLTGLKLYDKHGKFVGLERTDTCTYLVGYKRRKGGKKALQKVCLNEKSKEYVEQVIQITQPLRNYLKGKEDENYQYLFLTCRIGFSHPFPISNLLSLHAPAAFNVRVNQFEDVIGNSSKHVAAQLVKNLSPTKFRATVGLQVYLDTGSAKAMSEALGHTKYKPELLSHYLPEPILAFFQSRWIRIFQKGIVCESMKDSPMLLRASHFNSIEELDKFLTSHVFSLPNDRSASPESKEGAPQEIYISVDQNILTALLSLKLAVQLVDTQFVSAKANFWSKFSTLLEVEIEKNTHDAEIFKALQMARDKANPGLMKNFVYGASTGLPSMDAV